MDACISVCTVAKSSIHRSSHSIPSVEFSPTNSPKDEGKLFIHSNPFTQVHIVYTSVTKLLLVERLVLLYLLGAMDGNVITVRGYRNVIVCKIVDRPPPPPVLCSEGTKDEDRAESCDPSPECEPKPRLDVPDKNAHFTLPINFFILYSTCNNNTQQQVPSTIGVSVSQMDGKKQRVV
jgi:hypothetical protein